MGMAIGPVSTPALRPAGQSAQSPAKAEAVRAAQRAFFQAALNQTQAPAAQAAPVTAAAPRVAAAPEPQPDRYSRPGSRIDIKV